MSSTPTVTPNSLLLSPVWLAVGLVVITTVTYSAVGTFGSINLDDAAYVYGNAEVIQGLTWSGVQWAFTNGHAGNWHPLTWLSHMLDVQLLGLQPGPHHLVNLLLHVVNTLLLFGFLHRATGAAGRSALVAALFAVHPLHVESVVWISERKDVLSTLFFMLTLWAYAAYAHKQTLSRYMAVFLLLGLGLMAKPMLVTLPFVLLLLDVWPLKRFSFTNWNGAVALRLAVEKIPLFLLVTASSFVTFFVQREWGAVMDLDVAPLNLRLSISIVSYIAYIGHMAWPSDLAALYPYPAAISIWKSAAALVLLLALTGSAIMAVRRFPYVTVGWLWYLGMLVPVIGIVQVGVQAMADRYTYVPLIGLFVVIAWGGHDLLGRGSKIRAQQLVLGIPLVAMLAVMAWVQSGYWADPKTLWKRTLTVTSNNSQAHVLYGKALWKDGLRSEALVQFEKALRVAPALTEVHTMMGDALVELGRPEEAIPYYTKSLRLQPDYHPAHIGFGQALTRVGSIGEAMTYYQRALVLKPKDPFAHEGLGSALDELDRVDEAIAQYYKALEFDPEFAAAPHNLAAAFARQGRIEEAVNEMQAALQYEPDNPDYHHNYALLVNHQGDVVLAIRHLEQALELDPLNQAVRQALQNLRRNQLDKGKLP